MTDQELRDSIENLPPRLTSRNTLKHDPQLVIEDEFFTARARGYSYILIGSTVLDLNHKEVGVEPDINKEQNDQMISMVHEIQALMDENRILKAKLEGELK